MSQFSFLRRWEIILAGNLPGDEGVIMKGKSLNKSETPPCSLRCFVAEDPTGGGLNDVPVCVVKDRGYNEGRYVITVPEHSQFHKRTGIGADISFPNCGLPSLVPNSPRPNVPELMRDEITELRKRAGNTPLLKRKDDPLRNFLGVRPQSRTAQDLHLSSGQAMRYRPGITENINYSPGYLEQEIKILEKLHDILQTDSLVEIQDWLAKASLKEKAFVSNFIHSDVTSRDLLNYQQKAQDKNEAETLNLQDMLKVQKAINKGSAEEGNQLRTSSKGSLASKGLLACKGSMLERDHSHARREKIRIPTSDNLQLEHSPSKHAIQGCSPCPPASRHTSSQLLYRKSRSKRSQRS